MTVIDSMDLKSLRGDDIQVQLLHPKRSRQRHHETTVITGQNGSHKSTLLKQIVERLGPVGPSAEAADVKKTGVDLAGSSLLCISGSLADRFPQKELSSGARTKYDVPNYMYVGQRVMNNLLSRKAPLETVLGFALTPEKAERFQWNFFRQAHAHASIEPLVEYQLTARDHRTQPDLDLRGVLEALTPEVDKERSARRKTPYVSYATAQWLLETFTRDDFEKLQNFLSAGRRNAYLKLSSEGVSGSSHEPNVLRLGLLLDVLGLGTVKVRSTRTHETFSAFELTRASTTCFSRCWQLASAWRRKRLFSWTSRKTTFIRSGKGT